MDTSWIHLSRVHLAYKDGVIKFIELAKENLIEGKTRCPCKKCKLQKWFSLDEVEDHILFKGFYPDYDNWVYHGKEDFFTRVTGLKTITEKFEVRPMETGKDDIPGLLNTVFGMEFLRPNISTEKQFHAEPYEQETNLRVEEELLENNICEAQIPIDQERTKYMKLLTAANDPLYSGCTSFSKLSFILHLFHLKCMHKWSGESFTKLLELLVDAFPQILEFPQSYYEGKKLIKDLGLGYEKIDACPNNCVLYWGNLAGEDI